MLVLAWESKGGGGLTEKTEAAIGEARGCNEKKRGGHLLAQAKNEEGRRVPE